jgi:hypothetical protein
MKRYAEGGMSADTEADLQALKTLKQPDYDVGGPKRRYARGKVKRYAGGGSVSSASKRADGCAMKGKTRGKMV